MTAEELAKISNDNQKYKKLTQELNNFIQILKKEAQRGLYSFKFGTYVNQQRFSLSESDAKILEELGYKVKLGVYETWEGSHGREHSSKTDTIVSWEHLKGEK